MKYVNGMYICLVLMLVVSLVDTTIFNDQYSGIATFVTLGIFIIGNGIFINSRQIETTKKK